MKKLNFWALLAFTFGVINFSACTSNDDLGSEATLTATALDDSQIGSISDNILASADEYVLPIESSNYAAVSGLQRIPIVKNVDGVIITVDKSGTEFPKTITLDYGTTGIKDKRDNVLKGKIIIVVSNKMTVAGSTRSYSFVDFSVNDNKIKGSKLVTFNGETDGKPSWSVVVEDTVVKVDGKSVIVNSTRTRTLTDNNATPKIYFDDSFSITGSATGVNARGVAYTMTIEKPLITVGAWPVFVAGTTLITSEKRTVLIDYGDGTKDFKATATVNGVTKEFNLRK
jgi:hypothetical protein